MTTNQSPQVALVTGANRGIGFAAVEGLARTGMTVFLCARDSAVAQERADSLRAQGLDVRGVQLDTTDSDSIRKAAAHVQQNVGRMDVLVNNAGIPGDTSLQTAGTVELNAVRDVFETNAFGVIAVTEAMLPLLRRSEHARIINLSSSIGSLTLMSDPEHYFTGLPGWLGYPPSKAALNMITVQYAKQLRPEGILVNAADPGPTDTSLGRNGRADVTRTPAEGAQVVIELATTTSNETGTYRRDSGPVPW